MKSIIVHLIVFATVILSGAPLWVPPLMVFHSLFCFIQGMLAERKNREYINSIIKNEN